MTTEVVGGTVRDSTLYAGAGKPDGEAVRVVIAAVATLCVWCATEFASPNDKCFVKQATLFQVANQPSDRLVNLLSHFFMPGLEPTMLIPWVSSLSSLTRARQARKFNEPSYSLQFAITRRFVCVSAIRAFF